MNRLVLLFILFCGASLLYAQSIPVGNARVLLVENQTIHLKMGETCTITLDERNKGQYAWTYSFSENSILYKKSENFSEGKRSFVFATSKAGEVNITMTLTNRQTGAISKAPSKIYKVAVLNPKSANTPTMAAVSAKPVNMSKPMPSSVAMALPKPENIPVYAVNNELHSKSGAPTNEGFYPTVSTSTTTRGTMRGAAKNAVAPQPTTSTEVSSFHTNARPLSVFRQNVVRENEVFAIDIEENIPTGKWVYVVDKSSIQLVDEEIFDKSYGLPSKHKLHSYKFKATQAGVYDILFHVFSTENHTIDKYITYTVEVR